MIDEYKKNTWAFNKEASNIIKTFIDPRWDDFDTVVERLNAPEVIDYYIRKRIRYVRLPHIAYQKGSARYVFRHNIGDCVSTSYFAIYCLRKAGYWAREMRVPGHHSPTHAVCLYESDGKKFIMDNGRPRPIGIYPLNARNNEVE